MRAVTGKIPVSPNYKSSKKPTGCTRDNDRLQSPFYNFITVVKGNGRAKNKSLSLNKKTENLFCCFLRTEECADRLRRKTLSKKLIFGI